MFNCFLLVLFVSMCMGARGDTDCDSFSYGSLCPLYPTDNLIGIFQSLTTEIECQEQCRQTTNCNFFTLEKFADGGSSCFLFKSCNNTLSCPNLDECAMAVSGPPSPSITDACCTDLEHNTCSIDYILDEILNVSGEEMCQDFCREARGCSYWSLITDICLLYLSCEEAEPCSSCISGPSYPDLSTCNTHRVQHSLVMGGDTSSGKHSTSLELITSKVVCTPDMPPLPVARTGPSAVLIGSKIFYCGGYDESGNLNIHGICHSYILGQGITTWREEQTMVFGRYDFGLTAIGNTVYATGGIGEFGATTYTSVESYTLGGKWELREDMVMKINRIEHCSVALGSRLIVIGGSNIPNVDAFDTENPEAGWVSLTNMNHAHRRHDCLVGDLEGQTGVYVSGYWGSGTYVEFYFEAANRWLDLEPLSTGRSWHTMTMVNNQIIVAGGYNMLTSIESLNGTAWNNTNNLKIWRQEHAAISLPSGLLHCNSQNN